MRRRRRGRGATIAAGRDRRGADHARVTARATIVARGHRPARRPRVDRAARDRPWRTDRHCPGPASLRVVLGAPPRPPLSPAGRADRARPPRLIADRGRRRGPRSPRRRDRGHADRRGHALVASRGRGRDRRWPLVAAALSGPAAGRRRGCRRPLRAARRRRPAARADRLAAVARTLDAIAGRRRRAVRCWSCATRCDRRADHAGRARPRCSPALPRRRAAPLARRPAAAARLPAAAAATPPRPRPPRRRPGPAAAAGRRRAAVAALLRGARLAAALRADSAMRLRCEVDLEHAHGQLLADLHDLARVLDELVGELRDVDEAVLVDADVDERAERGDVGDDALEHHARLEVLDRA